MSVVWFRLVNVCLYKCALKSNSTCKVASGSEKYHCYLCRTLFYCVGRQEVLGIVGGKGSRATKVLAQIQTGPHDTCLNHQSCPLVQNSAHFKWAPQINQWIWGGQRGSTLSLLLSTGRRRASWSPKRWCLNEFQTWPLTRRRSALGQTQLYSESQSTQVNEAEWKS